VAGFIGSLALLLLLLLLLLVVVVIVAFVITFMQGIYNYLTEPNHASTLHNVATLL
jgi:uncharacterized protein (UPF0333 family)